MKDYLGSQYADSLARSGAVAWEYVGHAVNSTEAGRGGSLSDWQQKLLPQPRYNSSSTFRPISLPARRLSVSKLLAAAVSATALL